MLRVWWLIWYVCPFIFKLKLTEFNCRLSINVHNEVSIKFSLPSSVSLTATDGTLNLFSLPLIWMLKHLFIGFRTIMLICIHFPLKYRKGLSLFLQSQPHPTENIFFYQHGGWSDLIILFCKGYHLSNRPE